MQFTQVQAPPLQHVQFAAQAQTQALQQLVPQHEMLLAAGAGVVMFATASMRPKMIDDIVISFLFCSDRGGFRPQRTRFLRNRKEVELGQGPVRVANGLGVRE